MTRDEAAFDEPSCDELSDAETSLGYTSNSASKFISWPSSLEKEISKLLSMLSGIWMPVLSKNHWLLVTVIVSKDYYHWTDYTANEENSYYRELHNNLKR